MMLGARTGVWSGKALPYDYLVEYIHFLKSESYDSNRFDSGLVSEDDVGMRLEIERIFDLTKDSVALGVRDNTVSNGRFFVGGWKNGVQHQHYFGWGTRTDVNGLRLNAPYSIGLNFKNSRSLTIDDSVVGSITSNWNYRKIPINVPIYTYTNYTTGQISNFTGEERYKYRRIMLSKGYDVVRDYVPCVKDGEVCMFDNINQELKRFIYGGTNIGVGPRI